MKRIKSECDRKNIYPHKGQTYHKALESIDFNGIATLDTFSSLYLPIIMPLIIFTSTSFKNSLRHD